MDESAHQLLEANAQSTAQRTRFWLPPLIGAIFVGVVRQVVEQQRIGDYQALSGFLAIVGVALAALAFLLLRPLQLKRRLREHRESLLKAVMLIAGLGLLVQIYEPRVRIASTFVLVALLGWLVGLLWIAGRRNIPP